MSKKIPICKADITKDLDSAMKPEFLSAPKVAFEVYLEVDDATYEKITDDAKLAAFIFEESSDTYKAAKEAIIKLAKDANAECKPLEEAARTKIASQLQKDIELETTKAEAAIEKDATAQVKKWLQVRKDKSSFKLKAYFNGAVSAFGVAMGIKGILAAPLTAGSSAVLGIYGIAKSLVNIANEIKGCWAKVEPAEKALKGTLETVIATYRDLSKSTVGAAEVGAALLQRLTKVEAPTISRASKEYDLYKNAIDKLDVTVGEYATALNKLLDGWETVDQVALSKAIALVEANKEKSPEMEKLDKLWEEGRKAINGQMSKVEEGIKRVVELRSRQKFYDSAIKDLEGKKGTAIRWIEVAIALADFSYSYSNLSKDAAECANFAVDAYVQYQEIKDMTKKASA